MTTAGPSFPGTVANDSSAGDGDWSNPSNVGATDTTYATIVLNGTGAVLTSHYLKATTFGFSIPSGATVNGISASVIRKASQQTSTKFAVDSSVKLVKGGTIGGTDKADTSTKYLTSDGTATYGGSADLWGQTWLYSDINASNFGIAFASDGNAFTNNQTVSVDSITLSVTYTASGGTTTVRRTISMRSGSRSVRSLSRSL